MTVTLNREELFQAAASWLVATGRLPSGVVSVTASLTYTMQDGVPTVTAIEVTFRHDASVDPEGPDVVQATIPFVYPPPTSLDVRVPWWRRLLVKVFP